MPDIITSDSSKENIINESITAYKRLINTVNNARNISSPVISIFPSHNKKN